MRSARFNRRTLLQGSAAGAAALAMAGRASGPRPVAAQDATQIEFWTPANDPVGSELIQKMVDGFNAGAGAEQGIFVNARIKPAPNSNYTEYTTAMTSSGSPDVVMTYTYYPVSGWAANGFIQPLDDYATQAGIKEEDFYPITWTMINFADHIWGLLQEFDFDLFWWNKTIHTGEPPKTIDELDTFAAQYNVTDSSGNLTQAGFIPWLNNTGPGWNPVFGGNWYDFENRKWTIDKPENAQFLQWFLKHVDLLGGRDKADALVSSVPATYGDIFQYGKVVFALEGEYLPVQLTKQGLDLDYGITSFPTFGDVPQGTVTTGGGNLFLLPSKSNHAKEAVAFIQFMGVGQSVLDWCIPESNLPPTKAELESPSFAEQLPELKPWIDTIQQGHMIPPVPSPNYLVFNDAITLAIDEVTYKQKSPEDALAEVASKVKSATEEFQSAHPDWEGE